MKKNLIVQRENPIWDKNYQKFLVRLKQARIDSKMTQIDVSIKISKNQGFVSKCESGERRLDIAELFVFSKLYGKQISFFTQDFD